MAYFIFDGRSLRHSVLLVREGKSPDAKFFKKKKDTISLHAIDNDMVLIPTKEKARQRRCSRSVFTVKFNQS